MTDTTDAIKNETNQQEIDTGENQSLPADDVGVSDRVMDLVELLAESRWAGQH